MSKITYDQISSESSNSYKVGFFSLKEDNDEAIVRILHDSVDTFEIYNTHQINVNGKYRRINCVRDPHEPLDNCPLCAANTPIQQRIYIHLIQYNRDQNGNVIPEAKVWERSASFARDLKEKIDNYGPLSECLFKIKRRGARGDMKTTYSIDYLPPQIANPGQYPKAAELFEGYSALGTAVMDKTAQEVATFIATGSFPTTETTNVSSSGSVSGSAQVIAGAPAYSQTAESVPFVSANPESSAPAARPTPWATSTTPNAPWQQPSQTAPARPVRYN